MGTNRYRMDGGLIGSWSVLSARMLPGYAVPEAPFRLVQAGHERFVGCLDRGRDGRCEGSDLAGELFLEYLVSLTYDRRTGRLVEGICLHSMTSGEDDFAGTRGVLTMTDRPVRSDGVRTTYAAASC